MRLEYVQKVKIQFDEKIIYKVEIAQNKAISCLMY